MKRILAIVLVISLLFGMSAAIVPISTHAEGSSALGDVNGDGLVDTTDAKLIMQFDLELIDESVLDISVADTNFDGQIDTTDAKIIMQFDIGTIPEIGHTHNWIAATCLEPQKCSICGETYGEPVGHCFDQMYTVTEIDGMKLIAVCSMCQTPSGEEYPYNPNEEEQETRLWDCANDFAFFVTYAGAEEYIYDNLVIYSDLYELGNPQNVEINTIPFVVEATDDPTQWKIYPKTAYEDSSGYVVKLSGNLSFRDYDGKRFSFRTTGPDKDIVEYSDNILFLKALEQGAPGYYPYSMDFSDETMKYTLVLSKQGIFDQTTIGRILCVGDCTCADDVWDHAGNIVFGKIEGITSSNGKTVITLGAPSLDEIYSELDLNGTFDIKVLESQIDETFVNNFLQEFVATDGFAEALASTQTAVNAYAADLGYTAQQITTCGISPKDFKFDAKVEDRINDNGETYVFAEFKIDFEKKLNLERDSEVDGIAGTLTVGMHFSITMEFTPHTTTNIKKWQDLVTKDLYVNLMLDHKTIVDFTADISLQLKYEDVKEALYIVNLNSDVIHTNRCASAQNLKNLTRMTYSQLCLKYGKEVLSHECKNCKPLSMDTSGFVVNKNPGADGKRVIHCINCRLIQNYANYEDLASYEVYPVGEYTPCGTCLPAAKHETLRGKTFEDYLKESAGGSDWKTNLEEI